MAHQEDPEIIFSDYTQHVIIEGHPFDVEIYKTTVDPGWVLSVENQFGTLGRRPINGSVIQGMKQGGFHVWNILVDGRTIH